MQKEEVDGGGAQRGSFDTGSLSSKGHTMALRAMGSQLADCQLRDQFATTSGGRNDDSWILRGGRSGRPDDAALLGDESEKVYRFGQSAVHNEISILPPRII